MDKSAKDARHVACVALNREIAQHARRKELTQAMALFSQATQTDGANTHTFAAAINCSVRCGDLAGATAILEKMKTYKKGIAPDVVICTTIMKGFCEAGDLVRAVKLLDDMKAARPRVEPNIRTINTFMRGCVLVGAISLADGMVVQMQRDHGLQPDISTWEYLVVLLCQGLRLDKALPLVGRLKSNDAIQSAGLATIHVRLASAAALLADWRSSRRALADAKAALAADRAQADAGLDEGGDDDEARDDDDDDEDDEDNFGYQKEATGGRRAWKSDNDASRTESLRHFRQHRRGELHQDVAMIEAFIKRRTEGGPEKGGDKAERPKKTVKGEKGGNKGDKAVKEASLPKEDKKKDQAVDAARYLLPFFRRLLSFPAPGESPGPLLDALLDATRQRFGLDAYLLRLAALTAAKAAPVVEASGDGKDKGKGKGKDKGKGKKRKAPTASPGGGGGAAAAAAAGPEAAAATPGVTPSLPVPAAIAEPLEVFREALARCLDADQRIDFSRVFAERAGAEDAAEQEAPSMRPLKLEICSGAGEWAVAQAAADPASSWVTLELRHDRVNQTFSRAAFHEAHNLCMLGGDAMQVLPHRLAANTFSHVFINHPEPPQQRGRGDTSEGKHLLTPAFFAHVARILEPKGTLVVATDNAWYARFLLHQFATMGNALQGVQGPWAVKESEGGIHLYGGRPGKECGVPAPEASSYFDRLWNRVQIEERFYLVLSKDPAANTSLGSLASNASTFVGRGGGFVPKTQLKIKREGVILQATGKKIKFN